jgi:hypothetical protein
VGEFRVEPVIHEQISDLRFEIYSEDKAAKISHSLFAFAVIDMNTLKPPTVCFSRDILFEESAIQAIGN